MKLNLYALVDNKANNALVRFAFGSNDSSFIRDNLPMDIYNDKTKRGLPFPDMDYYQIATVDIENFTVEQVEKRLVDKEHAYQFKVENPVEKKDDNN